MTRSYNGHGGVTEFSQWLRAQKELSSARGFVATNVDYVWRNYKTGQWFYIEEKRYNGTLSYSQIQIFSVLHQVAVQSGDKRYRGFYLVQFAHTSPDDGAIRINDQPVTVTEFKLFLAFTWRPKLSCPSVLVTSYRHTG